ncbi:Uncharacterized protein FWK35_00024173, partial [Aphis craccivora]
MMFFEVLIICFLLNNNVEFKLLRRINDRVLIKHWITSNGRGISSCSKNDKRKELDKTPKAGSLNYIVNHDHAYHITNQEHGIINHDHDYAPMDLVHNDNELQELTHEVLNLEKPKRYLACVEKKTENSCRATAHISPDQNDDKLVLCKQHNHQLRPFNEEVPLLRQKLTEKALQKSVCSYSSRGIYMEEIINFPNAAQDYTFLQGSERMRRLRQKSFPKTPDDIEDLHTLLMSNSQFTLTLQNPSNKFYQGSLLINQQIKGLIFCNISNIQLLEPELRNVRVAGCDGTFKTVPKFKKKDAYQIFTFQVIYKNVSFPLVYAILSGKTEEIYVELLSYIRNVLPLTYSQLTIITDYEYGLMNAIKTIFPESDQQGCYFHFCQAIIRFIRNKKASIYHLITKNEIAARVLRMIHYSQVLALPYLPAIQTDDIPSMEDGFQTIVDYVNQFPNLMMCLEEFLFDYIWRYWFETMGPTAITVFKKDIRTNNFVESYHASLLRLIKPHPKVWEFLNQLLFLENQSFVEFRQLKQNLKIRNGGPTRARTANTEAIKDFLVDYTQDLNSDRLLSFLRRAGHRVDGYIIQEI